MPVYEYQCEKCSHTFDKLVMHRDTEVECPECRGEVKKLMSAFAVGTSDKTAAGPPPAGLGGLGCTKC